VIAAEIEAVWADLEGRSQGETGTFYRRVTSDPPSDVLLGLRRPEGHPLLILRVDRAALGALTPTESAGIALEVDHGQVSGPRDVALVIELLDPQFRDLFASLTGDLIARLRHGMTDPDAVSTLSTRLRRWQSLLRRKRSGLSLEEQRGLFAELEMLLTLQRTGLGMGTIVDGWVGPSGAERDLELSSASVEIKGSASSRRNVLISSEYQLSAAAGDVVYLAILAVDEADQGRTLGEQVDAVRGAASEPGTLDRLEQRLSDYGWMDEHRPRYESPLWGITGSDIYRVHGQFPRLDANELPIGLGNVSYSLDQGVLAPYRLDWESTLADIAERGD